MNKETDSRKPLLPQVMEPNWRLRHFTPADVDKVLSLHADRRVRAFLLEDEDFTDRRTVQRFLIGLVAYYQQQPGLGFWALEQQMQAHTPESLTESGLTHLIDESTRQRLLQPRWQLIGWYNVTRIPHEPGKLEAGARLHPSVWGSRVVSVVAERVIRHALHALGQSQLGLYCDPANRSALYRAAYLGFTDARETVHSGKPAIAMWTDPVHHQSWWARPHSARRRDALALCRRLSTSPSALVDAPA